MSRKIVISFDFELGWGVLDSELWRIRENSDLYENLRPVFGQLMHVLNETEIQTTWAIVSSLLVESESELDIEHLPSSYKNDVVSFYRNSKASTRCGLDLVDSLQLNMPLIEIASHTSTHIYAKQKDVKACQYVSDVKKSISTLEYYFNQKIETLIFPRDQSDFNNEIASYRPLNFRLNPRYGLNMSTIFRVASGVSRVYSSPPSSRVILGSYGELYQTGSLYFNWLGGKYEYFKKILVKMQASRVLSITNKSSICHIWLHPFNLAESKEHFDLFVTFLHSLSRLRDKGVVEVVTMKDISELHKM